MSAATASFCWVCGGRGRRSTWINAAQRDVEAECPECDGKGYTKPAVPVPSDEAVEALEAADLLGEPDHEEIVPGEETR